MLSQDTRFKANLLTLGLAVVLITFSSFTWLREKEAGALMGDFKQDVAHRVEMLNAALTAADQSSIDSLQFLVEQRSVFEGLEDVQMILWEPVSTGSKVLFIQEQEGPLLAEHAMSLLLNARQQSSWRLEVVPSAAYLARQRGFMPYLVTGLQLLVMLLLGRMACQAGKRARLSGQALDALRIEYAQLCTRSDKLAEDLKKSRQRLVQELQLDPLTGIANRHKFEAELDDECRRAVREFTPLTLVRFELNELLQSRIREDLKLEEDLFKQLVSLLQGLLTRPGDRIARYNDFSLVFLLPATNEHAGALVQRCCDALQALDTPLNHAVHVGVATLMPSSSLNAAYAREQLEIAMQSARELPVNQYHHRVEGSEHFPLTYAD